MIAATRPIGLTLIIAAILITSAVLFGRAVRAGQTRDEDLARLSSLRSAAAEVASLRTAAELLRRDQESSAPRLATACGDVLAAAGLPASALVSLSPEAATTERIDKITLTRARATLALSPITLPQLGRFLDAWRQRLAGWAVARLDVEPRRDSASAPPGSDLPLRVVITVETTRWNTTEHAP